MRKKKEKQMKQTNTFQKVMSDGMRRPMHSILGLLSMIQDDNLKNEQKLIVDAMLRTSNVLSNLINDAMDNSTKDEGRFSLEIRSFGLHSMLKEAACLSKCMCVYGGFCSMVVLFIYCSLSFQNCVGNGTWKNIHAGPP